MSNGTIGRLYTKDFAELKRSEKISFIISVISLMVSVISLIVALIALYLSFNQTGISEMKIKKCNEVAIGLEKARHYPQDDLQVTNQDISSYLKNIVACLSD